MTVLSLLYHTELLFHRFDGEITDRGGYFAVRTPNNPGFHWGNFLLFSTPPADGDLESWKEIFAREVGTPPIINHFSFAWDTVGGEEGVLQPFLDAGFDADYSVTLTATEVQRPPKYSEEVIIRPLADTDADWNAVTDLQILCRDPEYDLNGYTTFKQRQFARYRKMARAGMGNWFGAFLGETLVADCGIYHDGEGTARFQSVETHPDYRRRGICGAMVYQVARYGLDTLGAKTLVMVADEHYHAARIYESVGFRPSERTVAVCWWPRNTA
jgi:RimJ/RimL family protein N-acetyltransferase